MSYITYNGKFLSSNNKLITIKIPNTLYGYLYNWYTVSGNETNLVNNLRVPNNTDFNTLTSYIGAVNTGGKLKEDNLEYWLTPNTGASNEYNFNARGAGQRSNTGIFQYFKERVVFWTSSTYLSSAYYIMLRYNFDDVISNRYAFVYGFSIRCIRDLSEQEQLDYIDGQIINTEEDFNGNKYNIVKIGTQGWMNSNLKATNFLNGDMIPYYENSVDWTNLSSPGRCYPNNNENNV